MTKTSVLEIMTQLRDSNFLNKEVFTIAEVATYTGYEQSYIAKLCRTEKIPHFLSPTGGKVKFFLKKEIVAWLTSNPVAMRSALKQKADEILNTVVKRTVKQKVTTITGS